MFKKIIALSLCFTLTLPVLWGCSNTDSIPTESTASTDAPICNGKSLKLLAITSSFGLNTTQLLYDIAKAEGVEEVIVARLYISGCTLQMHAENIAGNLPAYQYTKNSTGYWETFDGITMEYGLKDEDWDVIFIQQGAAQSPLAHTYGDYLDQILPYVNKTKTNPDAPLIWNMTWAYQGDSTQTVFVSNFQSNQMAMYDSILSTLKEKILPRTEFAAIIPSGTAVQNARTSYFGDTLTKDTYHLNNLGRAIAGYTLYSILTDKELTEINLGEVYSPDIPTKLELSDSDRAVIIECVNNAIKEPYAVTPSAYTEK